VKARIWRFIYEHRALPKRLVSILAPRPVLLNLRDFKMYVRLDDWAVGVHIARKRTYEEPVTTAILPFLKPRAVVVDIGANIGYYTLLAASRVGPEGKVIAFEPSAESIALLRMSLQENNFQNVTIHAKAVAQANGILSFRMSDSIAVIHQNEPAAQTFQVDSVALDSFLKDEPRIDLIKIDIDGGEGLALRGMKELLKRHRPALFTEFCPALLQGISGVSPEAYLDELRSVGYGLRILVPKKAAARLSQGESPLTNDEIMQFLQRYAASGWTHLDLLALPDER
jgi:FkbM family methyltransferase